MKSIVKFYNKKTMTIKKEVIVEHHENAINSVIMLKALETLKNINEFFNTKDTVYTVSEF